MAKVSSRDMATGTGSSHPACRQQARHPSGEGPVQRARRGQDKAELLRPERLSSGPILTSQMHALHLLGKTPFQGQQEVQAFRGNLPANKALDQTLLTGSWPISHPGAGTQDSQTITLSGHPNPPRSPEHSADCLQHHFAAESSLGGLAEQSPVCGEAALVPQHAEVEREVGAPAPTLLPPSPGSLGPGTAANEDAGEGGLCLADTQLLLSWPRRPVWLEEGVSPWTFQSGALRAGAV